MQQAARVSQRTTFFHLGKPIEYGATEQLVSRPQQKQTGDDISGRIG